MRFPLHITTDMMKWQLHNGQLKDRLSLQDCLQAVDEAGTPVVSICGGEPTIYPELAELVEGIIARKRHIYLCTNGILLDRFFAKGRPHKRLSINVHLDGMQQTHDFVVDRSGVFDTAVAMIKEGKRLGYAVCTNTTIYRETSMEEIEAMCAFLTDIGIDGILLSPGYHYDKIKEKHFLFKNEIHEKFKRVLDLSKRYRVYSTPLFLQFAAGQRDYPCTPWGNPTRTPKGWKGPCYLIEGAYYKTWKDFWNGVDWDYWESRQDAKCQNCLMHSGFEPSVVRKLSESPRDLWTIAKWNFLS
jgi:hopanoid biosynthesis associated radical SAM protein HpnH